MAQAGPAAQSSTVKGAHRHTEESRALLQTRLAEFGRIGMLIGLVFLAIAVTLNFVLELPSMGATVLAECAAVLTGATTWLLARGRKLTTDALEFIDLGCTFTGAAVFLALGWALPLWSRPEFLQLLCVTDILMLRAFLVPSTARRTATLGAVCAVAITVSTFFQYAGHRPHPDAPDHVAYAIIAATIAFATVLLTALTSRTIFGLRQRVREASEVGQYTLLEKIGEGGMGLVYKARHAMLRRQTAIKLLPVERAGESNLSRFEREAQLTSMLTHPNTVSIYDYGRTADGILYYAMEYLDGIDLETLVELDGPQPEGRVIHILRQIAGALSEAHGIGLIHRDVKPANVFLCTRSGNPDLVKVLDFGLVKSLGAPKDAAHTATDQIIGTPLFMSPEAISAPEQLDGRSDLYALGALGYFLLTGEPPFSGTSVLEICSHHLHSLPKPPSERLGREPGALDATLLRCLEKSPELRPANAAALVRELDAAAVASAWSDADASAWWTSHEGVLAARQSSATSSVQQAATIAIDLRKRRPLASAAQVR